ncbi:hypothetical protein [Rhizobium etli]|uniref:hypothetical protein n=1 Tax=Rhizobium etli TaxID=29449 RepID=UPI000589E467|nr:hypothetical protein [Rhizobium sp. IE4771]
MENRIVINRLAMTGPERETREIGFVPGLNVIWGASNAGKSFIIKSLDYMFGSGSLLPEIKQREGMELAGLNSTCRNLAELRCVALCLAAVYLYLINRSRM